MPFVSHCLMQLQQGIIFRSVQFSALPPKIVSAPVVLFQSTWDSWSYHQPNSHNYQRHFPHDFNQETSTKVNQVVQLLWYLCVFDTDKIFVTGLHLQVRIPQHCIWPTVFHNKNFNNVDFTMSKNSPSIHRYPPTLNLRWQFCHPIHCPGWAHPVHQGSCSQQILEKSPPPCMVSSGSKNLISSIHHTYCRKECIQHKYLIGDATALNISYTKVRIKAILISAPTESENLNANSVLWILGHRWVN